MKSEFFKTSRIPPRFAVFFVSIAAAGITCLTEAGPNQDSARTFLTTSFGLSGTDVARLDAGQVVSRTLDSDHAREVATLGIVRIATTPEQYVTRLADIATFKRTDNVLQIGTFSDPPHAGDVAALTLDDADVRQLQACQVDDCGLRISATRSGSSLEWWTGAAEMRRRA